MATKNQAPPPRVTSNITIEDAKIRFRNFSGKEGPYNAKGSRNFAVLIDPEAAEALLADGWNIRWLEPRNEDEDKQAYLKVAVSYEHVPPKIIMMTGKGKTLLDEESINLLDWAEIDSVDLVIRPYNWEVTNKFGVKAYIKTMYVTLVEDEFEKKYYDVPESAASLMIEKDAD